METRVVAAEDNYMGFGKHAHLTYGQVLVNCPAYATWAIKTDQEKPEAHWRLRWFAKWAAGVSPAEKHRISLMLEISLQDCSTGPLPYPA